MGAKYMPEGYNNVSPYLVVEGADKLIDFMINAFGAKERLRMPGPGGAIGHAEMELGDSVVMLGDSATTDNNRKATAMIHLYVEDADETFKNALAAGAKVDQDLETKFYGDRGGSVIDRWGNIWWISTHVEDVPPDEMELRAKDFMAKQGQA
jgi:PhnB protein